MSHNVVSSTQNKFSTLLASPSPPSVAYCVPSTVASMATMMHYMAKLDGQLRHLLNGTQYLRQGQQRQRTLRHSAEMRQLDLLPNAVAYTAAMCANQTAPDGPGRPALSKAAGSSEAASACEAQRVAMGMRSSGADQTCTAPLPPPCQEVGAAVDRDLICGPWPQV